MIVYLLVIFSWVFFYGAFTSYRSHKEDMDDVRQTVRTAIRDETEQPRTFDKNGKMFPRPLSRHQLSAALAIKGITDPEQAVRAAMDAAAAAGDPLGAHHLVTLHLTLHS